MIMSICPKCNRKFKGKAFRLLEKTYPSTVVENVCSQCYLKERPDIQTLPSNVSEYITDHPTSDTSPD